MFLTYLSVIDILAENMGRVSYSIYIIYECINMISLVTFRMKEEVIVMILFYTSAIYFASLANTTFILNYSLSQRIVYTLRVLRWTMEEILFRWNFLLKNVKRISSCVKCRKLDASKNETFEFGIFSMSSSSHRNWSKFYSV